MNNGGEEQVPGVQKLSPLIPSFSFFYVCLE